MQYTYRERTVKSKTVNEAIQMARQLLKERYQTQEIELSSISNRSVDEQITVEELNDLVNTLVDKTRYYSSNTFRIFQQLTVNPEV